jgi:hypothetical protein
VSSLLPPAPPKYPEHEKLRAIVDKSQKIGEFIDWLKEEKNISLMSEREELREDGSVRDYHYFYEGGGMRRFLEEFFEIDGKALEAEKQAMLEEQRKLNDHGNEERRSTDTVG